MKNKKEIKTKEDFCPICLVGIPLLFSGGIGTATALQNNNNNIDEDIILENELYEIQEKRRNRKRIIHWCMLIFIICVFIIIYFKFIKPCDECR